MLFLYRNNEADAFKFLKVLKYGDMCIIFSLIREFVGWIEFVFILGRRKVNTNFTQRLKRNRRRDGSQRGKMRNVCFEYRALIPRSQSSVNIGVDASGGDMPA